MDCWEIAGLRIASDVSIPGAHPSDGVPDLVVEYGPPTAVPDSTPPGTALASYNDGERRLYAASRTDTGYLLRAYGLADFSIDENLDRVCCRPGPDVDEDLVTILLAGAVVALVLSLRGRCVLHGSSVVFGERGLAFVGASGMGKSTLAAQFCAAGAHLVTDDLLPVEVVGDSVQIVGGVDEVRLRPKAAELASRLGTNNTRQTADKRTAARPTRATASRSPLHAIVIPVPTHDTKELIVRRVAPSRATFELASFPRVPWSDHTYLGQHFDAVARVAERVPLFHAIVPWGPPFPDATVERLSDLLSASAPLSGP